MVTTLQFYYDIGSPNAYLAWRALSATPGIELDMRPVLIGGLFKSANNQPPWQAFGGVPLKMRYMMTEIERFTRMYGLAEFAMNPHFPVNTLLPMRAATAALAEGVHAGAVAPLMRGMWEAGEKLSDPDALARVLDAAGLDGAHLVSRAGDPDIKQALMDATAKASERGVFGLPAWFADANEDGGEEMWFGKDCVWMMHPDAKAVLPG